MAQKCTVCGDDLRKILITNKGTRRALFKDEVALYNKQEELDDLHLECKDCTAVCLTKTKPTMQTGYGHCTNCGGLDLPVFNRPVFSMFQFATKVWTCPVHIMQFQSL